MYIGVDVGGTNIKAGLVDKKGKLIKFIECPTEAKKGKKKVIDNIISLIETIYSKNVKGIGVGIPGSFKNFEKGIIYVTNNTPLNGVNLKKEIGKKFKCPIHTNNDANCFVLAEALIGGGKSYNTVLGLTLGTGLGSGLVIDKKIYFGRGNAFEYGSSFMERKKTVEYFLGKKGIIEIAKKHKMVIKEPIELFKMAKKGNKKALKAWEEFGLYLGKAIVNLAYTLDPEIFIIGGQIANAWPYFSKSMKKTIKSEYTIYTVKVVKSVLNRSGVIGASLLSL